MNLLIVGTRPQLVKAAALLPELADTGLVDTGQHWDHGLAGSLFDELGLPEPAHSLGLATNRVRDMRDALLPILQAERPEVVIVVGDTNSTLAATLAAVDSGVPVAHVEAGLRTFEPDLPEERNRVLVDSMATWLFAPTMEAAEHLIAEDRTTDTVITGDVLADAVARYIDRAHPDVEPGYVFATVHRAANREPGAMRAWLEILGAIDSTVILALHPGTRSVLIGEGLSLPSNTRDIGPVGYRASLSLQLHARAVVTDSGGIERESSWLGTPVVVLRECTEWPGIGSTPVGLNAYRALSAIAEVQRKPERIPTGASKRIAAAFSRRSERVAA